MATIIGCGMTVRVLSQGMRVGGKDVHKIECFNSLSPLTLTATYKSRWWMIYQAPIGYFDPYPLGTVGTFPQLNDRPVLIPLMAHGKSYCYIESKWLELLPLGTDRPAYPFYPVRSQPMNGTARTTSGRVAVFATFQGEKTGRYIAASTQFEWTFKSGTWLQLPDNTWVNCGASAQYATIISYPSTVTPPPPPPPTPQAGKFAIIKHLPAVMSDPTWKTEVNVVALQDTVTPVSKAKGSPVLFLPDKQAAARKVQDEPGYTWAARPGSGMIIRHYIGDVLGSTAADGADPIPKIECVSGFGNLIKILESVQTRGGLFHKIDTLAFNAPVTNLSDWFHNPTQWMKMTARTPDGRIMNVGSGLNSYVPLLRRTNYLWIHNDFIEFFPTMPPEGTGWILRGASVFMQTTNGIKPLRLARIPGELIHPDPRWKLETRSVIPEVRADWVYPDFVTQLFPR